MPIISDSEEQSGEPVVDFETEMRQSMGHLTTALLGDEKQGIWGITKKSLILNRIFMVVKIWIRV